MEDVLHYLELKNQYYEKFYNLTVKFISQTKKEKWDDVDLLVDNRDRILNIINSFDVKITKIVNSMDFDDEQRKLHKPEVEKLIARRMSLAEKIIAADLELIGIIDEVKSETIRELKVSLDTANQISAFAPLEKRASKPRKEA